MTEESTIKEIMKTAYVEGIHTYVDESRVRSGFHPEFRMLVPKGNELIRVPLETWLENMRTKKENNPDYFKRVTKSDLTLIDVTEKTACIKIKVYDEDKHIYTDYMFLYKFSDGWKIVSKVFTEIK